jgi:hypothetical protein
MMFSKDKEFIVWSLINDRTMTLRLRLPLRLIGKFKSTTTTSSWI